MANRRFMSMLLGSFIIHGLWIMWFSRGGDLLKSAQPYARSLTEMTYYETPPRKRSHLQKTGLRSVHEMEPSAEMNNLKFFVKNEFHQENITAPISLAEKDTWMQQGQEDKAVLPVMQQKVLENNEYRSYRAVVRQRIKQRAYFYRNHPGIAKGEVYVAFILNAQGKLQDVHVVDAKTSANALERSLALRSVQESSPFPPFPDDLDFQELSFGIPISYVIGGHIYTKSIN